MVPSLHLNAGIHVAQLAQQRYLGLLVQRHYRKAAGCSQDLSLCCIVGFIVCIQKQEIDDLGAVIFQILQRRDFVLNQLKLMWMASAINSLPVPLSPVISTEALVRAMRATVFSTSINP